MSKFKELKINENCLRFDGASGNGSEIMPLIIDNIKKKAKASMMLISFLSIRTLKKEQTLYG